MRCGSALCADVPMERPPSARGARQFSPGSRMLAVWAQVSKKCKSFEDAAQIRESNAMSSQRLAVSGDMLQVD